jgi:hypothetical protein
VTEFKTLTQLRDENPGVPICTVSGHIGDCIWAGPALRAVAEHHGQPVLMLVTTNFASVAPLAAMMEGVAACYAHPQWPQVEQIEVTWEPPEVRGGISLPRVYHLGFRHWPNESIPLFYLTQLEKVYGIGGGRMDPWLKLLSERSRLEYVSCSWGDQGCEVKMGVTYAVSSHYDVDVYILPNGRYEEWPSTEYVTLYPAGLQKLAEQIWRGRFLLTCLSAPWVIANALGVPTVVMEPMTARHNPIFWFDHERNVMVRGNDGLPTFDARATVAAVKAAMERYK